MDVLVSRAPTMRLSLQPTPPSETSAFSKIRAFSSRRAGLFPFRISVSSCSRSSPLSLTTYFFTETSFEAMIAPIAYSRDDSESQNLNPCKRIRVCAPFAGAQARLNGRVCTGVVGRVEGPTYGDFYRGWWT